MEPHSMKKTVSSLCKKIAHMALATLLAKALKSNDCYRNLGLMVCVCLHPEHTFTVHSACQ